MRRILILLVILVTCVVALVALWIFRGSDISSFIDRFWTVETASVPIHAIAYEGNGTDGILTVNELSLRLNEVSPKISLSVGSTKDNQFALASNGKVFAFGPLAATPENIGDHLATVPPASDQALVRMRHSVLSWPTPSDLNFMTGHSPSWKRNIYYEVHWKKTSGAKLEMLWRYEQLFYPGKGWGSGFMTREGVAGLIRVEIKQ